MIATLLTLTGIGLFLWARPPLREMHHAYLGLVLSLPRLVGRAGWAWISWAFGLWLILDDAYEHARQHAQPDYASPLHRLYALGYRRWAWLRTLTAWCDRWCGKQG